MRAVPHIFQNQQERKHQEKNDPHEPEDEDERKHRRLTLEKAEKRGLCAVKSIGRRIPARHKAGLEAFEERLCQWAPNIDVAA